MSEQLEPLATEAGQQAIVRAINNLSSLEYAVRAEHAATAAAQSADDALTSATNASNSESKARDWAEKTNGAVETETIITPPETEGDPPTEELVSYFSAKYWAQMAEDYFSQMTFDTVPTEDSTNGITSGAVYDALATKQDTLTFDNAPTQNSVNPVKSGGVYSALDTKADKSTTYTKTEVDTALSNVQGQLTFDSTPTANSTNPVTSGGIYTALQGVGTGDVTTNTDQNITGTKTFVGSKKVAFKQSTTNDKLGFTLFGNTGTERGYLEFNPTNTVDGVTGLMTIGNYATSAAGLTQVGFRRYSSISGASGAYNLLMPMVADARTPFSLTTTYQNFYLPLGFTDGTTTVKTAKSGVVDISSLLQNVSIDVDDEITEDSDNPVTSAAIYEALQNIEVTGGAGNASGITREELYNGTPQGNGTLQLSDTIDKYDFIEFRVVNNTSSMVHHLVPCYISVPLLLKTKYIDTGGSNTNMYIQYEYGNRWAGIQVNASDNSKLIITNANEHLIKEVYGIKFSKNLSEQMSSNVLYESSTGTTKDSNITLSDSYKNYDLFAFNVAITNESPISNSPIMNPVLMTKEQLEDSKVGRFSVSGWGSRSTHFIIVDDTTFQCKLTENDQRVYKIIGYKMAKGGYSGIVSDARMTVKSGFVDLSSGVTKRVRQDYNVTFDSLMPDTNYIVNTHLVQFADYYNSLELTITNKTINGFTITGWLQADNNIPATQGFGIDWIAIRPNSYTREGMVEDVLFSNASGVNSGTINLSGNISDYDLIMFETNRSRESNSLNQNRNIFRASSLHELTDNTSYGNCILVTGFSSDYLKFAYVNDNTLNIFENLNLKLLKIVGIKFGRYVGGVAIDSTVTQNSNAVVTSGAVYDALQNVAPSITIDSSVTQNGTNAVSGSAVYTAIQTALNSITNANGVSY